MSDAHVDGFGSVTWWGFSPALNLIALHEQGLSMRQSAGKVQSTAADCSDCISVLLVGSGDLRHVLTTVANASNKSSKHTFKPIHFYVVESCLEVLARHMLFLTLLVESPYVVGLQEKAEIFLELYGNSLVRAHTSDYLRIKATDLIKMITDNDHLKACLPLLDTSPLKFKERDLLEGIFKFWKNTEDSTFDISQHWNSRLRRHLGVRYDSRSGVCDWDYHMKLQEMAPIINCCDYCEWREKGLAFHLRDDAPYETPNRTLASGLLITQDGEKVACRGYWGDIVNSPYLSFGIRSENKDLFKEQNGKIINSSVHVSNYNLISLIHKLTTGEDYTASINAATKPPVQSIISQGSYAGCDYVNQHEAKKEDGLCEELKGPLFTGSCYVTFLPLGFVPQLYKKAKYRKLFNIAYFSNSMVHHLKSEIEVTFAPDCTLVLETAQFMLDLKKEQRVEYETKIAFMAGAIGFKVPIAIGDDSAVAHLAFIS